MPRLILLLLVSIGTASPSFGGAIHDAAKKGDLKQVEQLIAQGADVNVRGTNGETPLTIAALGGRQTVVALLLEAGADLQIRNKGGLTPLHAAAYGGHRDVVELLLAKGVDVNDANNRFGVSPLHLAAEENRKDVVELLLVSGANVKAKEINGYTPLSRAGFREFWDVVRLLRQHGALCQPASEVGDWLYQECAKLKIQQ